MRLIDADALVEKICGESCGCHRNECGLTYEDDGRDSCTEVRDIEDAPTIDAAPVRRGEWGVLEIVGYDGVNAVYAAPCSACGEFSKEARLFCPNCGAKMGKEEHHELED